MIKSSRDAGFAGSTARAARECEGADNVRRLLAAAALGAAAVLAAIPLGGCSTKNDKSAKAAADAAAASLPQFAVKPVSSMHGSVMVLPELEPGATVAQGTKLTLTAKPDSLYVLDSLFVSYQGQWGAMYAESMTPSLEYTVDKDITYGAYFMSESAVAGFRTIQDVVYAKPGAKALKYDVFTPDGAKNLPLIVIVHGGGWSSNDENIMRGMAREMVRTGRYVAASIDYRWIGALDGPGENVQVYQLIEDVYGALAHIQEHAAEYGADPKRLAITGDSAGGHLSSSAATMIERIGDGGFGNGTYELKPTYIPAGKTAADVRASLLTALKAAAPSYGVFGGDFLKQASADDAAYKGIAPIENIPAAKARSIPHYLIRGTSDPLINFEMVDSYAKALAAAGQKVKHVEVDGAGHAFYDWKPDAMTRSTFDKYGVPYIKDMLAFIDQYL